MKKSNMDIIISSNRLVVNLENPFFSKDSLRDSEESQQLFNKNSSLDDTMRSIIPSNEKDSAYIGNLNNQ